MIPQLPPAYLLPQSRQRADTDVYNVENKDKRGVRDRTSVGQLGMKCRARHSPNKEGVGARAGGGWGWGWAEHVSVSFYRNLKKY